MGWPCWSWWDPFFGAVSLECIESKLCPLPGALWSSFAIGLQVSTVTSPSVTGTFVVGVGRFGKGSLERWGGEEGAPVREAPALLSVQVILVWSHPSFCHLSPVWQPFS